MASIARVGSRCVWEQTRSGCQDSPGPCPLWRGPSPERRPRRRRFLPHRCSLISLRRLWTICFARRSRRNASPPNQEADAKRNRPPLTAFTTSGFTLCGQRMAIWRATGRSWRGLRLKFANGGARYRFQQPARFGCASAWKSRRSRKESKRRQSLPHGPVAASGTSGTCYKRQMIPACSWRRKTHGAREAPPPAGFSSEAISRHESICSHRWDRLWACVRTSRKASRAPPPLGATDSMRPGRTSL